MREQNQRVAHAFSEGGSIQKNLESRELRFALNKDPLLPRNKCAASSPYQGEGQENGARELR